MVLASVPVIGQAVSAIIEALKSVGIIRTPEDELKAAERLAVVVAAQWQHITEFVRATTPDPARVYVWVNSLIAIIRPAVTILLVIDVIANPQHSINLNDARMWPVLWWFFGPEVLRLFGLRVPTGNGEPVRGGSAHLENAKPSTNPPRPFTSDTGFSKERSERL